MRKIEVALDKVREVKFSINAMGELEDRFDKSVPELFAYGTPGIRVMIAMVKIGLTHGGMKVPGRTVEDQEVFVGDLIQVHWIDEGSTMEDLMKNYIQVALQEAGLIPKEEDESEEDSDENPTKDTDE